MSNATLCWSCANACSKCSWSDTTFTPVKGWKADKTKISIDHSPGHGNRYQHKIDSYRVKECPQFKSDREQYKLLKEERRWY